MEIKSFGIKNYRSIKDSGVCYLSGDNITVIAGKNESGKTAILEALEDFNKDKTIREGAINIHHPKTIPEIAITFEIDQETLNEISNEIGLGIRATKPISIEFIKRYPNEYRYVLSDESRKALGIKDERLLETKQKEITDIYTQIKDIYSELPQIGVTLPEIDLENSTIFGAQLNDFRNNIQPNLAQIPDEERRDSFTQALEQIINKITELDNLKSAEQKFIDEIRKGIPNFILFSSFDDVFPSEIPLSKAPNNELVKDLDIISELNLELITSGSTPLKAKHKKQLNVRLREDYSRFWEQDLTNLSIDWDSNNLQFFITEGDNFYPPNMRSKGKQWHLAFYIRVSARAREDVPNIILIDEPGLYIHAQAQKDVIRKLEDSADYVPIVYSTHSPYLIEVDKLHRVRLISKPTEEEGTLISNKIHKNADKETLAPIITAIGLDLSLGLDIAKDNNIIFEGITDYYYVRAFQQLLKFKFREEVHFIPGAGADKLNLLASLMIGWGFNYCVVLDNDKKGRQIKDRLLRNFGHTNIKIISVSENKDEEIEDLFNREDFVKHVLGEELNEVPPDKNNSQIIKQKDKNYDKVLLSKLFFEKIVNGSISLSTETKQNFKKLLQRINDSMFPTV